MYHAHPPDALPLADDAVRLSGPVVAFGAMGLSACWSTLLAIAAHGPDWSQLPPILIAAASLVATVNVALNDRRRRGLAANPAAGPGSTTTTTSSTTSDRHDAPTSTTTTTATTRPAEPRPPAAPQAPARPPG